MLKKQLKNTAITRQLMKLYDKTKENYHKGYIHIILKNKRNTQTYGYSSNRTKNL